MMLGVIANRICEKAIFYTFNNTLEKKALSTRSGIIYTTMNEAEATGGTNMFLPFEQMIKDGVIADRIILISDNQCNAGWGGVTPQSVADGYRRKMGNKDIWVHAIDLMGYGTQQFCGPRTNVIAGWSEKVFDFILLAEEGVGSIMEAISNYNVS